MARHVVVGAGAIGRATASALVREGHEVLLASRSGTGPDLAGARRVSVDATDPAALTALANGAASLVNAVNPNYTSWDRDWPPMASAFLEAAEASGAGLVTIGNLYGYGPVDGPIHARLPLNATGSKGRVRAQMWLAAKAAHDAGRVRATEVRASDYFGPGASPTMSMLIRFVLAPAAPGRRSARWTVRPMRCTRGPTSPTSGSWPRGWRPATRAGAAPGTSHPVCRARSPRSRPTRRHTPDDRLRPSGSCRAWFAPPWAR